MISPSAPRLEGDAQKAVLHRGTHLQIMASARSGKTEVVAQRFADLIASGADPGGIIAFTFTERAAQELKAPISGRSTTSRSRIANPLTYRPVRSQRASRPSKRAFAGCGTDGSPHTRAVLAEAVMCESCANGTQMLWSPKLSAPGGTRHLKLTKWG